MKKLLTVGIAGLMFLASGMQVFAQDGGQPGSTPPSGGGGGGADTMTYDYSGSVSGALSADGQEVTSDGETYSTSTADQNAALVDNAGTLTITNGTLNKSGDDSNGDNCNFYGINSILLALNSGSKAYISDSTLTADSEGSNGIFATDEGTVYAYKVQIDTTAGNSRGLDATYGGTIVGDSLTISTQGDHSASIATDRGGGNISVTNSTLSTAGSGSPLIYSTGDIEVNNVTGTASGSQIAGMEGLNTILIYNSKLASTITDKTASDPIADGIIIYQSTSGDAESTTGEAARFEALNSTLSSAITSGSMFYLTNTSANVILKNTTLDFDSDNVLLLEVAGNDSNNWGSAGSNGATVNFTAIGETLSGGIDVDTISSLDLFLTQGTTYTGYTTISTNSVNSDPSDSPLTVNLDSTSTWILTKDSTISNLNMEDGAKLVDSEGKTVTIVANGTTVVSGDSSLTLTVTGSYSTSFETSEVNTLTTDYVDRSDFDTYYNLSTAFDSNTSASTEDTTTSEVTETTTANNDMTIYYVIGGVVIVCAVIYLVMKKKKH